MCNMGTQVGVENIFALSSLHGHIDYTQVYKVFNDMKRVRGILFIFIHFTLYILKHIE